MIKNKLLFLIILFINLSAILVGSYVVDYAIDCNDQNLNIYPGAREICNDGIDNNCNADESYLFDTDPNTGVDKNDIECCNLLSAQWSTDKVQEGTNVTLTVIGKSACNNILVNFIVKEADIFPNPDDDVIRNPETNSFKGTTAMSSWIAEYQNDGIGNPEYYFIASTQYLSITSSDPKLIVTKAIAECGDGNLDQNENCFTCPNDAGCNQGQTCLNVDNQWACISLPGGGCPQGQTLCSDNTCKTDCGISFTCNNNDICEANEGCSCMDCDRVRDACADNLICDSINTKTCQPDSDQDTVPDNRDNCPNTSPGPVDQNGCPLGISGCPQGQTLCSDNTCKTDCGTSFTCNNNDICEANEGCSCMDCDRVRDACTDNLICDSINTKTCQPDSDQDTVPDNRDNCPNTSPGPVDQNGCPLSLGKCGNGILELGETCSICPQDAPIGFCQDTCNNNNICEQGETCLCNDCLGQQDACIRGDMCNKDGVCEVNPVDGICTSDQTAKAADPECCSIIKANWNTNIAIRNSLVDLIVEGNDYCENRQVSFKVYEDDLIGEDTYAPPDPQTKTFSNKKAKSTWSVINVDDGFFQGEPEFYFIATSAISTKKSDLLKIIQCQENDGDCDGVLDDFDKCPDTPLEEIQNVDSSGCAPGEASCVAEWDCKNALWSECNEEGYRTRDINKCIYRGSNPICESKFKPLSRRACLIEEAFPVFTTSNILITLLILLLYYILIIKIKK